LKEYIVDVNWIDLAWIRDMWGAVLKEVMNLLVPYSAGNILTIL
jgi:hypothetical protein